jgi:UDP-N-acetylglucosamine 2-epimerase (non-hydrolysing)
MILVAVGTRPELLKMAPVVEEARGRGLPIHVHCTMQSPDLVDRAILPWDTEGPQDCLDGVTLLVVQGDTRTAFRMALAAYEQGIPIFHVEAGVRTYDLGSPWPEEGYRQMISRIATYHACSTRRCLENLIRENITTFTPRAMHARVTGSPIVESVRRRSGTVPPKVDRAPHVMVTLHRRENKGHFGEILEGIALVNGLGGVTWYSHPNGWAAAENRTALIPLPPCPFDVFANELLASDVVVTDSGGVQEECNVLGVPCVVARTETDRPESLGAGGAILGGVNRDGIAVALREAITMDRMDIDATCFGDGSASGQICDWLEEILHED